MYETVALSASSELKGRTSIILAVIAAEYEGVTQSIINVDAPLLLRGGLLPG